MMRILHSINKTRGKSDNLMQSKGGNQRQKSDVTQGKKVIRNEKRKLELQKKPGSKVKI